MFGSDNSPIIGKEILINKPKLSWSGSQWRSELEIAGYALWFESRKQLRAVPEAFVCAALLPAMYLHSDLCVDADLDPLFLENSDAIQAIVRAWWPQLAKISIKAKGYRTIGKASREATFFTGGVDSFFTLKRKMENVSALINVEGFDIPLDDRERREKNAKLIDMVAREVGKEAIHISTNIRNHPLFCSLDWGKTHISAIAAVAHSLSHLFSETYVASSDVPPPWGSHQDLDPLWSSSRLNIINDGWQYGRYEKVKALADWELVARYLKVCWENRSTQLNCGQCEKCTRTQAQFIAAGCDFRMETFPSGDIVELVNQLPFASGELLKQWEDIKSVVGGDFKEAVAKLEARSVSCT